MSEQQNITPPDIQPLDEVQIMEQGLALNHLWFLEIGQKPYGPYKEEDLLDYIQKNSSFPRDVLAANAEEKQWKPLRSWQVFDSRDEEEVPKQKESSLRDSVTLTSSKDSEFFLLKDGQRTGPYSFVQLEMAYDNRELLVTDYIQENDGEWIKISQHPLFDRRESMIQGDGLPFPIDADNIKDSAKAVRDLLKKTKKDKDKAQDAMVGLAFVSHQHQRRANIPGLDHELLKKEKEEAAELPHSTEEQPTLGFWEAIKGTYVKKAVATAFTFLTLFISGKGLKVLWRDMNNKQEVAAKAKEQKKQVTRAPASASKRVTPKRATRAQPKRKTRRPVRRVHKKKFAPAPPVEDEFDNLDQQYDERAAEAEEKRLQAEEDAEFAEDEERAEKPRRDLAGDYDGEDEAEIRELHDDEEGPISEEELFDAEYNE